MEWSAMSSLISQLLTDSEKYRMLALRPGRHALDHGPAISSVLTQNTVDGAAIWNGAVLVVEWHVDIASASLTYVT